jgi:hypothetical protein
VVDQNLWGSLGIPDSEGDNLAVAQYKGRANPVYRARIYLAKVLALEFERAGSAQLRTVVEAALLHELVHYVRDHAGKANYFEDNLQEPGNQFEEAAYGRHISLDAPRLVRFPERH